MKVKELEHKIIAQAWKDPEFKKKLLSNPNETVHEFIKSHCPQAKDGNFKFNIVEDKANIHTIVLPVEPAKSKDLSESELEQLAAGDTWDHMGDGLQNFFTNLDI